MTLSQPMLDRLAAAAVAEGLADAVYTRLKTPIGTLTIVQGEHGVVRVGFDEEDVGTLLAEVAAGVGPRIVASDRELAATRDAVAGYFEGEDERLDLPVDLALVRSPFRRSALEELRRVGAGEVVTYGELARRIAHPRAARAVGSACATNPVPIIVPCHRVVPGSGGVGSYGGGPEIKRRLLAHEGARVRDRAATAPRPSRTP
jgi:methylated-DNA-[protein]-cysteine S-methyltransferase